MLKPEVTLLGDKKTQKLAKQWAPATPDPAGPRGDDHAGERRKSSSCRRNQVLLLILPHLLKENS